MSCLELRLVVNDYGRIVPLACGDVDVEGVDLELVRDALGPLDRTLADPSIDAGELSLGRHMLRLAEGDESFVGIPSFVNRAFRHRCFFVQRDSGMSSLTDLRGKRIGTNEWPATGNTWARAALREQGVRIESIDWWVGTVEGGPLQRSQGYLPDNVRLTSDGQGLERMLLADELDALMLPVPPPEFYRRDSRLTRLIPDFRMAEREYWQRTGIYPVHHIIGIRRPVFESNPWVATALYRALDESRRRWQQRQRVIADTIPWLLADIEDAMSLMGEDWAPDGIEPNAAAVEKLIDEQVAQGLMTRRIDPRAVFEEFRSLVDATRPT